MSDTAGGSSNLAERVITAYGGRELWSEARKITLELSAWGWAFRLKWQRPFRHVKVELDVRRQRASILPIDGEGNRGVLEGRAVRIEDRSGHVLEERSDPADFFPYGRRALWWDRLDQTYFAGYAAWNYFTLPALLIRDDITWTQVASDTLEARFPNHIATHNALQKFCFDPVTGLLKRHDYTAEVFGGWAKSAHLVLAHRESEGLWYTSSRRAYPRAGDGTPRKAPLLVGIEAHSYTVEA